MEMTDLLKKHFADIEAKVGAMPQQVREAIARLDDLEQKVYTRDSYAGRGDFEAKSWGEQFTESDGLRAFAYETSRPRRFRMDLKTTITSAPRPSMIVGRLASKFQPSMTTSSLATWWRSSAKSASP